MQIPHFRECQHPLVSSLVYHSDLDLSVLCQRHPEQGRYFTAIFCRYSPLLYSLIWHEARSPVQVDYLFALSWRHIFYELSGLEPAGLSATGSQSLQSWLIRMAGFCINRVRVPSAEAIDYRLDAASPPLWCYLELALERLQAEERLAVLMAQTFRWREEQIAEYLSAQTEARSLPPVSTLLANGYQTLEAELPEDIRAIYLDDRN